MNIFRINIPATTTNLGPGFDCLGMSINLYNKITIEKSNKLKILLPTNDIGKIPTDKSNLIIQAMNRVYEYAKVNFIPISMEQENNIPYARGLGSSAACVVGGILAANHLLDNKLSFDEMLKLAVSMDGHPDNVLPAFTGGLTAATLDNTKVRYVHLLPHAKFKFVFIIPNFELKTSDSRKVLPSNYSKHDAVVSVGKAVVLTNSLVNGQSENLKSACDDLLHQPYRKSLIPHYDDIKEMSYNLGADAFYLSGAGPTMACIVSSQVSSFVPSMKAYLDSIGSYKIIQSGASKSGAYID